MDTAEVGAFLALLQWGLNVRHCHVAGYFSSVQDRWFPQSYLVSSIMRVYRRLLTWKSINKFSGLSLY